MPSHDHHADEPEQNAPLAGDILRGVLDPLLTLDGDLRVNSANPAFYETYRLTPEQTLGRSIYEIGGGLWDIPHLRDLLHEVRANDRTFRDYEVAHEFESGRRTMLLNACKLLSSRGRDSLILLAMKDITARKEAEEALRRSEQKLRMILDNAQDFAIIGMDLEGRVTFWNPGAERLLGYRESEILGEDSRVIFTQEAREQGEADAELGRAIREGRAEDERWHVRKDGGRFWGSGLVMALYEDHEIRGLLKIMRDMTPQFRLRQEREARARELERRVAEATAESEERARQLVTLNRHLYQAEMRERQRLAQVLHDDLQQMLVALNMRLQMAENQAEPQTLLREARNIADQAIDTARSLSHELSPSVLRERGFVPAIRWLGQNIQERHQLPVQVEAADQAAETLPADVGEVLFQMVRELLFNVVKHARASQAWVSVEALSEGGVRITVDDDGVGCNGESREADEEEGGFGLVNIRERLAIWRGELETGQRPGGGCRVILNCPRSSDT